MRTRVLTAWVIAFPLVSGCAPSGTHYNGTLLDGPAAAFSVSPNDDCKRADVTEGISTVLNQKIGRPDGPPTEVVSAAEIAAIINPLSGWNGWEGNVLNCHGLLTTKAGTIGPGTIQIRGIQTRNSSGKTAEVRVQSATWESDEDREKKEAMKRVVQTVATDPMESIRQSAEKNPNEIVGCGVEGPKSVHTSNAVCYALIRFTADNRMKLKPYAGYSILQACGGMTSTSCLAMIKELQNLSRDVGVKPDFALVEGCADDLAKNGSGNEKPQNMNVCETLLRVFR